MSSSNVTRKSRLYAKPRQKTSVLGSARSSVSTRSGASVGSRSQRRVGFQPPPRRTPAQIGNLAVTPSMAHAYWDAALHSTPPSLPTTYGNFTVVNSIARFSYTTTASSPAQLQFAWNPSPLRTTSWNGALTAITKMSGWQQSQLNANNTVPLDIRPLRMSVKIRNTTQALNIASNVVAVLIPQSISLPYASTGTTTMPNISAAGVASMWALAENNPKAVAISGAELSKRTKTFVMPPSSFTAYNTYSDWLALTTTSDNGTVISLADWLTLNGLFGEPALPTTITNTWFGATPTNYIMLLNLEPNTLPQTYEIEVFCQDAARFPANSLVASMEHIPTRNRVSLESLSSLAHTASSCFSNDSRSLPGQTRIIADY